MDEWEVWGELEEVPLSTDDFFYPENKALWQAFRHLYAQGIEITAISTLYALDQLGLMEACDRWLPPPTSIEQYLFEITDVCFSARGSVSFAKIIKDYARRRGLMAEAQRLARAAHEPTGSWQAAYESRP